MGVVSSPERELDRQCWSNQAQGELDHSRSRHGPWDTLYLSEQKRQRALHSPYDLASVSCGARCEANGRITSHNSTCYSSPLHNTMVCMNFYQAQKPDGYLIKQHNPSPIARMFTCHDLEGALPKIVSKSCHGQGCILRALVEEPAPPLACAVLSLRLLCLQSCQRRHRHLTAAITAATQRLGYST